jgi:fructoselysine 6-phosphate deglycase
MKTELNPDIATALQTLANQTINHVFLVACGGSLSIMHSAKYFLDRHSVNLSTDLYNADEFVTRDPKRLGKNALVILCSQTGTTKETVRAVQHARMRGAHSVAMTLDRQSPLASAADHVLEYQASYTTGVAIDSADSNYGVIYMFLAGLLERTDDLQLVSPLLKSLSGLQPAIERAHVQYRALFEKFAPVYAAKSAIYTLASGPQYGAAYSYAICVLMEMQWYDSQALHANEFFHGPFEVVDNEAAFIVLVGLDETRRLTERAKDFLLKYGAPANMLVLDAADLDLSGMEDQFKPYLVPLIFFDALWKFAYKLAEKRNQPMLDGRRYMKKISGY